MKRRAVSNACLEGEGGAVIIWSLGLLLLLFFAGAVALDLWRVVSSHGTLTAVADKSAVAGAAEIDARALRSNQLRLVPTRAVTSAEDFARTQPGWDGGAMTVRATADSSQVSVEVTGQVPVTLLRMFTSARVIELTVDSRASPALFE
ncbi:MAG: pilus assembly protein TadG-related protein [bacterium]|nr:pilus assembly protein TadG-related protein [bacterium]MDE0287135.1 pilus assembly protein TadG-related protein [bacterium]MDE0437567.1 pilus assembly protein TadG-related protein [bacterium]